MRLALQGKLAQHKVEVEAFLKVLQHQERDIYAQQLEGVFISLSNTLDIILNPHDIHSGSEPACHLSQPGPQEV